MDEEHAPRSAQRWTAPLDDAPASGFEPDFAAMAPLRLSTPTASPRCSQSRWPGPPRTCRGPHGHHTYIARARTVRSRWQLCALRRGYYAMLSTRHGEVIEVVDTARHGQQPCPPHRDCVAYSGAAPTAPFGGVSCSTTSVVTAGHPRRSPRAVDAGNPRTVVRP